MTYRTAMIFTCSFQSKGKVSVRLPNHARLLLRVIAACIAVYMLSNLHIKDAALPAGINHYYYSNSYNL